MTVERRLRPTASAFHHNSAVEPPDARMADGHSFQSALASHDAQESQTSASLSYWVIYTKRVVEITLSAKLHAVMGIAERAA